MTPRIGVDLDGVVYDWQGAYTYLANKHLGARLDTSLEWWTHWNAPDQYLNAADRAWIWTTGVDLGLFRYGHHLKGSVDGLRELAELGTLEIVTHRPSSALKDTLRFIENLPDVISGVHFLSNEEPKSSVGCDIYVDDAPHVVREVALAGHKAVLFDQPWNRDLNLAAVRALGWNGVCPAVEFLLAGEDDNDDGSRSESNLANWRSERVEAGQVRSDSD